MGPSADEKFKHKNDFILFITILLMQCRVELLSDLLSWVSHGSSHISSIIMSPTSLVHLHYLLVSLQVDLHQVAVLVESESFKGPHNVLARNRFPLLLLTPITSPIKSLGE